MPDTDYIEYPHWRDVPAAEWKWRHFSPAEMACRGTGKIKVRRALMDKLEALRRKLGNKPILVTSGYRSPEHNAAVGGAPRSKHMLGEAADVMMANHDPHAFEEAARAVGFRGFGYYQVNGFMHIDLGPERSWGEPWPDAAPTFDREQPPGRASLSESRTMKTVGVTGVVGAITAAAPAIPVARDAVETVQNNPSGTLIVVGLLLVAAAGAFAYFRWDDWRAKRR